MGASLRAQPPPAGTRCLAARPARGAPCRLPPEAAEVLETARAFPPPPRLHPPPAAGRSAQPARPPAPRAALHACPRTPRSAAAGALPAQPGWTAIPAPSALAPVRRKRICKESPQGDASNRSGRNARHAGTRFHNPIGSNELLKGHSTLPPPRSIAILHSRLRSTSRCSYKETKRPAPRGSLPPPSQLPIPPPHRGRRNAARKRPISAALPTVPAAALPPLTLAAGEGLSVSSQNQQTRYTLNAAPPLVRAPGRPPALYTAGAASFQNHREPSLTGTGEGVWGRGRAPLRGGAEPRSANSRRPRKDTVRARGSRGRLPLLQSSG